MVEHCFFQARAEAQGRFARHAIFYNADEDDDDYDVDLPLPELVDLDEVNINYIVPQNKL